MSDSDWPAYYAVTAARPPWGTVVRAADLFGEPSGGGRRVAVDLGCGAGRDTRELLRRGWRVIAVDREPAAIETITSLVTDDARGRLDVRVADLGEFPIPPCDLVNASLSLQFLAPPAYRAAWSRMRAALPPGGRFAAMLFGDRDGFADDPTMTCLSPEAIREDLDGFDIEHWVDMEEDAPTALGDPHHWHRVDVVARRR